MKLSDAMFHLTKFEFCECCQRVTTEVERRCTVCGSPAPIANTRALLGRESVNVTQRILHQ